MKAKLNRKCISTGACYLIKTPSQHHVVFFLLAVVKPQAGVFSGCSSGYANLYSVRQITHAYTQNAYAHSVFL